MTQTLNFLPGRRIPQPRGFVPICGGELLAVGAVYNLGNVTIMMRMGLPGYPAVEAGTGNGAFFNLKGLARFWSWYLPVFEWIN